MKMPIQMHVEHLSSIITAMLLQRGQDSFTLSNDEFDNLGLSSLGLECTGDIDDSDEDTVLSMTVTIRKL